MKYSFKDFPEELQNIYLIYWKEQTKRWIDNIIDKKFPMDSWYLSDSILIRCGFTEEERQKYRMLIAPFMLSGE